MPASATYRLIRFNGRVVGVSRLAANTSFAVPAEGEDDARHRENADYLRYLDDVAAGAVVAEPEPIGG